MNDDLDQLLQRAGQPLDVPQALMARILADAAREQRPPLHAQHSANLPSARAKFWQFLDELGALFGGRGALAGLASVAVAGIYLGAAQPAALMDFALTLGGSGAVDQLDFMPSIDVLLAEE